jgi:predicted NBD/HSP70 family sugar kinase
VTKAIGIDVGGSKIAACLVDVDQGVVVESLRVPTQPERGGPAVLADCIGLAGALGLNGPDARREVPVGVGICELVSPTGQITSAATLDWRRTDLSLAFGGPVVVESDVRAAAVGESRLGAGRDCSSFVYVTVGTGVAFSLIIAGTPYLGARGNALILGSPPVESTASGAALSRLAGTGSAEEVFERADAAELVRDGTRDLGRALAWLFNALDPELVVVGGGLGLRSDYREEAVSEMRRWIDASNRSHVRVVAAELGADAGAVGVALLAAERRLRA